MQRKLVLVLCIVLAITAVLFVAVVAGLSFPLVPHSGVRGGGIEFAIFLFLVSLVGLYWLISGVMKRRKDEDADA